MNFSPDSIYHIYNRGNDKQPIFFLEENYSFFLNKIKQDLPKLCDILAYCLMPNHFHLLIYVPATSEGLNFIPNQNQQILVRKLGSILSSYSQAINKQENRTGSLFQQKTKSKLIDSSIYSITCFHYIHQNPLNANLVSIMEDWPYSSFSEYLSGDSTICNISLANELLDIPLSYDRLYKESYLVIDQDAIKSFF
jgi:putative transposase